MTVSFLLKYCFFYKTVQTTQSIILFIYSCYQIKNTLFRLKMPFIVKECHTCKLKRQDYKYSINVLIHRLYISISSYTTMPSYIYIYDIDYFLFTFMVKIKFTFIH